MTPSVSPLKPNNILKIRFARHFLRALKKLDNTHKPRTSSSIYGRYRMVKTAADASMVSAVGSRRAWSRAMISRIKNRILDKRRDKPRATSIARIRRKRRRRSRTAAARKPITDSNYGGGRAEAEELRTLVPGGEAMDLSSLLGETAHYIKCLTTQVLVMKKIVDHYSTTSTTTAA